MMYRQPFAGGYPITQGYSERDTSDFHTGIDYGLPLGTPVLASEAGTVVFAGWDNTGYGNCVIIRHSDGNATLYAHLAAPLPVHAGERVQRSEVIGYSGSTGNSTGPHLHFEARRVWNDYKSHFDPMRLGLMSVDDSIQGEQGGVQTPAGSVPALPALKGAEALGENVVVVAPDGARRFNLDWSYPYPAAYNYGQRLCFTGRTTKRPGYPYTYCEVYVPSPRFWVAVNDGKTQILDNAE